MNKKLNCLFLAALITAFTSSLFAASREELIPAGTEGFPLIKIISTENDGNNDFVTKSLLPLLSVETILITGNLCAEEGAFTLKFAANKVEAIKLTNKAVKSFKCFFIIISPF